MKRDRPFVDPRWLCLLVVGSLVVFHWVNNWLYFRANVTLLGWDPTAHLAKTIVYNNILKEIDIRSLFQAFTWPWNRPPLPWLPAVLLYRLFGVSTDVALMSNSFYIAILLFSVYGIGKRLYGPGVGLLSAFLVSTYPFLFHLSRTLYPDFPLTAMVASNIYFLLRADRFRDRLNSLLFGLTFGLGLLTKWQFLAFVAGPVVYVIVRSGAIRDLGSFRRRRKDPSLLIRLLSSPWVHMVVALILVTVWYLPNWDRVVGFLLGPWLLPISWALVASTFYLLSRKVSQGTNLLSALFLGTVVGSIWSLPNIGYLRRFFVVAYGGVYIEGRAFTFLGLPADTPDLPYLVFEQMSPLYFFALLVAILISLYYWKGGSLRKRLQGISDNSWVLILWFVVPFLIFTFSLTKNPRFDVALLPSAAIITSQGFFKVRKAMVKGLLMVALVSVGMVEFFALSYDDLGGLREGAILNLPLFGRLNLFAEGVLPASGPTDKAYWIAPRILGLIREEMVAGGKRRGELGVLISRRYLNAILLGYLIMSEEQYAGIELRNLARGQEEPPIYPQVFECDYVVFKGGSYDGLNDDAREAREQLQESPAFFQKVFELAEEYPLPDGDTVYLYRKRYHLAGGYNPEDYRRIGEEVDSLGREGDGIVIVPPEEAEVLGRYIGKRLEPYLLPREGASVEEMERELVEIVSRHGHILGVFWEEGGIEGVHLVEGWLNEHGYRAWENWYGGARLVLYATPLGIEEKPEFRSVEVDFGEGLGLLGYSLIDQEVEPGGVVRLVLYWEAKKGIEGDYKVFIHLVDERGQLVAQRDSQPQGGSKPTSGWEAGEEVEDHYGVWVSEGVAPGEYELVVGIYEPESGERLLIVDKDGVVIGDKISLGMVEVVDE
ncbi:MAG: ArnT family glycosyltransferase [Anaerolineae bacterium]